LAYSKLTGKAKLKNDLAQLQVKVTQAQDALNATRNGKPLYEVDKAAYDVADKKFQDAVTARNAAQLALDNYKEPEKPKSAKQIEAERQQAIIDGKVPPAGGIVDGQPNTNQTKQVDDFAGLIKTAPDILRKMTDDERLVLAAQLKNAGYDVPQIKAYNDALLGGYTSLISGAKAKNKQFPNDIKTVDDFLTEQTNITAQIKAAGGTALPDPYGAQPINSRSSAEGVIDNLFQTFLKRDASKEEIDSLYKNLVTEQKKLSSISKGTYKMVNGRRVLVQEEGLDPRVFLENKIKELPAYKESLVAKSEQNKLSLASTALANGYDLERDFGSQLPNWLDAINKGESISKFQSTIRNSAKLALPEAVRNSIDPNEDLTTAFATYISNYSKTFGVPPSQVSLNKILPLATNDKGFIPIYEFEKKKRQLAEWDNTQEARTETANVVSTVLKDFGFKG
jgi:hypothetical protein